MANRLPEVCKMNFKWIIQIVLKGAKVYVERREMLILQCQHTYYKKVQNGKIIWQWGTTARTCLVKMEHSNIPGEKDSAGHIISLFVNIDTLDFVFHFCYFAMVPAVRLLGTMLTLPLCFPQLPCQQTCLSKTELPARIYSHLDLPSRKIFLSVLSHYLPQPQQFLVL